jgi:hypothetical protein
LKREPKRQALREADMSSKRNWILGAIMVVAVVIGYLGLTGKVPPRDQTQGAIGAAHRYQAQQIAAGDVTLTDARIQAFLQTDLFHKVATDAKFRAAISNPKFQMFAKNPTFQKMASQGNLSEYLSTYKGLFQREDFDAMLASKKLQNIADTEKMVKVLQNKSFAEMAKDPKFVALLKDPKFEALMEQSEAQKGSTAKDLSETAKGTKITVTFVEMGKQNTFNQLLADDVLQQAAKAGQLSELADLLQSSHAEAMLSDASFQELLANPKALSFVTSDEMAQVAMGLQALAHGSSASELLAVASDPEVAEAFRHPEMQELANADLLQHAVESVKN